jgi:hypothetical protein
VTSTALLVIAVVVAALQFVTALMGLGALLVSLAHRRYLRSIDRQTNHMNEVLRLANATAHEELVDLANRLVGQLAEELKKPPIEEPKTT